MSPSVERLAELRRHLDHLRALRPRVAGPESLRRDLSLHNDVLFSLLTICQSVIDLASELSSRRGLRFGDYTEAVRNLSAFPGFSAEVVRHLERLPGFRNVLIHEYATLDYQRVVDALDQLQPVEEFLEAVRRMEIGGA
jgi:uncharacterized protein YutE (UPF0331/DUF86 family)